MARSTPLHIRALISLLLVLIGTLLLVVVFEADNRQQPSTTLVVRNGSNENGRRELGLLDPKTVLPKVFVRTDYVAATNAYITSSNVQTAQDILLNAHLSPLPQPLNWRPVSDAEREATPTCSTQEPAFDYCCIGQCKKPSDRLYEQEGPFYDDLFQQPDMNDIVTMERLLPYLQGFVDQRRLIRRPRRPSIAYPTCTLWFIGDSTTEDQSMAAICQLLNLGYELGDCPVAKEGYNDVGDCNLFSTTSPYCPRIRVKKDKHGSWNARDGWKTGSDLKFLDKLPEKQKDDEAGVVIYSWGVHVNSREGFADWMSGPFQRLYDTFQTFDDSGRYAFMWREHEPQHFNSPGGLYIGKRTFGCFDVQEFDNFRNEEMHKYFATTGLRNVIPVIASYDALKPMYMFHNQMGDCSHYCYTPWRFDLTWHGIALGLRDVVLNGVEDRGSK